MLRWLIPVLLLFGLPGCDKRSGDAIVLTKERIAAAEAAPAADSEVKSSNDDKTAPDRNDEITVDSYVMNPQVRGTNRDPRALKEEQWIVKVRMLEGGRTFNVQTDQPRFQRLSEGDRVRVRYRVGKYTNTVWGAEIEEAGK